MWLRRHELEGGVLYLYGNLHVVLNVRVYIQYSFTVALVVRCRESILFLVACHATLNPLCHFVSRSLGGPTFYFFGVF